MRRALARMSLLLIMAGLTACSVSNTTTEEESSVSQHNILVIYTEEAAQAAEAIQAAISNLQPGALLGSDMLLYTAEDSESSIMEWAQNLGLMEGEALPDAAQNQTVATAEVTPHEQQVLYLWEENNAPAVTEYTQNTAGYSGDPDFRPYITTFPVPEGTPIKGAVLICPGGRFSFAAISRKALM